MYNVRILYDVFPHTVLNPCSNTQDKMDKSKLAIKIVHLTKYFFSGRAKKIILSDISINVQQGEVYGFLGPNGAGKSTTIKLLLHFLKPDSGELFIFDHRIGLDEFRHCIGYLSEFPFFYDHLTARETLLLSGRLSGISKKILLARIPTLLERMSLTDAIDHKTGSFSKGMKQRLGIANALVHNPEILILDEPMSGLDPVGRHQIKNLIIELKQEGKTIFFSSHILSDIELLCDRIGIINKGTLLYSGVLKNFTGSEGNLEKRFINIIKEDNSARSQ